ncbi:MAG: ATP-binding protein [Acidobacteriota bacterium]|nr:ATP-binding protein [Acidobacteriota bacterium]
MRHLLTVGPLPWKALGVTPGDWPDCEIHEAYSETDALRRLRTRAFDVVITHPLTSAEQDMPLVREAREQQPGIRPIMIVPELTPAEVIEALRSDVYACFTMPVTPVELSDAITNALNADHWTNGIQVLSALPDWIALRVVSRRTTADRLTRFMTELVPEVSADDRFALMTAFREVLLNAMEHGAGFDPDKVVEVAAVRTKRTIVYYFKDPGPGFNPKATASVATEADPIGHMAEREAKGQRPGGFGLLLTSKLVDEVHFNEFGNEVFLVKYLE